MSNETLGVRVILKSEMQGNKTEMEAVHDGLRNAWKK